MLFDFPEIVIICGVALVVLGPKKLPETAAKIGRWAGRARAMARQFKEQLELEVNSVDTAFDTKEPRQPTIYNPASSTPTTASVTPATAPSGAAHRTGPGAHSEEDFAAGLAATGIPESPPAPREPAAVAAPATETRRSDNPGNEAAVTSASDAAHR
jgi:sec-independent protein translocase protein TatB